MLEFTPVTDSSPISNIVSVDPVKSTCHLTDIDQALEKFLGFEVAQGSASSDTVATYTSQSRLFMQWCYDAKINPLLANKSDIQLYRRYLIKQDYKSATIQLKSTN